MKGEGGRPSTIICKILIFLYLTTLFISIRRFEFPFADVLCTEQRPGITQLSQFTPSLIKGPVPKTKYPLDTGSSEQGQYLLRHQYACSLAIIDQQFSDKMYSFFLLCNRQKPNRIFNCVIETTLTTRNRLSILSITSSLIQTKSRWLLFCQWTTFSDLDKFSDQDLRVLAVIVLGELRGIATNK